jgi:hypothetical protein
VSRPIPSTNPKASADQPRSSSTATVPYLSTLSRCDVRVF